MEQKQDVVWTIKVDKGLDMAVQEMVKRLGFTSKAELTREAIREYMIRHKLFSLLGGEPSGPSLKESPSPETALQELSLILQKIPKKELDEDIDAARKEVSDAFLTKGE
jgi:hypothetical protein